MATRLTKADEVRVQRQQCIDEMNTFKQAAAAAEAKVAALDGVLAILDGTGKRSRPKVATTAAAAPPAP